MLLQFRCKNYRSFKDDMLFNLEPTPKQKDLDYSILQKKAGNKEYKALCSSVIYGPNATGKSNCIGAIATMKDIVVKGNVRDIKATNPADGYLSYIPNIHTPDAPVCFFIKFIKDDLLFEYGFSFKTGLSPESVNNIVYEKLRIDDKDVFERTEDDLNITIPEVVKQYMVDQSIDNISSLNKVAKSNIHSTDLFLNNGFKSFYSNTISEKIIDWFDVDLEVIYRVDSQDISLKPQTDSELYMEDHINNAVRAFGGHNNIAFKPENNLIRKLSFIKDSDGVERYLANSQLYESLGTLRFMNLILPIFDAMTKGGTLLVDEFDASIHPMAIMNLVNIFHNDDVNTNKAQLIFNTHNPIFLNSNLFRRDEIKFVEYEKDSSSMYSLADFGTSKGGVRKGEDYMKNYFINKYGAISDVDFTDIIKDAMNGRLEHHARKKVQ